MLGELIERSIQQVDRELRRWPEAASLDENGFVVQDFRGLHDLPRPVNAASWAQPPT
jgi:hypothetical protein